MINYQPNSRWRIHLVTQTIAPQYTQLAKVDASVLVGSVARNQADRFSDIDMVIYWASPPTDNERWEVIQRLNGFCQKLEDNLSGESDVSLQRWMESFYLFGDRNSGLKIDVTHVLSDSTRQMIEDVTVAFDSHPDKLNQLYSLLHAQPLAGESLVQEWKSQIGRCPKPVSLQIVRDNLMMNPQWVWEMLIERKDWLTYRELIQKHCKQLITLLIGINRLYLPRLKQVEYLLSEMTILADNFAFRFNDVIQASPKQAVPELLKLVDEVFNLVETHLPEINTQKARNWFAYQRPIWANSPENFTNKETTE